MEILIQIQKTKNQNRTDTEIKANSHGKYLQNCNEIRKDEETDFWTDRWNWKRRTIKAEDDIKQQQKV